MSVPALTALRDQADAAQDDVLRRMSGGLAETGARILPSKPPPGFTARLHLRSRAAMAAAREAGERLRCDHLVGEVVNAWIVGSSPERVRCGNCARDLVFCDNDACDLCGSPAAVWGCYQLPTQVERLGDHVRTLALLASPRSAPWVRNGVRKRSFNATCV